MNGEPTMPPRLMHGTRACVLDEILTQGIKPRGRDGKRNNWKHTVGSNKNAVYLTDTYGLYFANCARENGDDAAIIEVDTETLAPWMVADEDVMEQAMRGRDDLPADWDMKRRTLYYRSRVHQYRPEASLAAMGTAAHRGTIPPEAITRICIVPREQVFRLILGAHDPTICLANHRFMGERHKQFHRWLFGDEPECMSNPKLTRDGIEVREHQGKAS